VFALISWGEKRDALSNIIYWFSGTGNSLYAAKLLADYIGDTELVSIANSEPPSAQLGGSGCKIGFVFPSYYGDLPRIVRSFAEKLNFLPGTDLFTVVTMGAFGEGSVKSMEELFAKKGFKLLYGIGLRMPANYILKYDPALLGAKSEKRVQKHLRKVDKKINEIADDIIRGKCQVKTGSVTAQTLYTDIESLDSDFRVTDKCTGCGLCEKVCPVANIVLTGTTPIWQHHCEHCVACISWCPEAAIEYGSVTERRTRYHNPQVKISELVIR
jgi:ferredoxin/flavodoxin